MSIRNSIFKLIFNLTVKIRREAFADTLESYLKTQYLTTEELEKIQLEKLKSIISHARSNTPYYRTHISSEIASLRDLKNIPVLDKNILRTNSEDLQTKYGHLQRTKTSGGSTGAPVSIVKNSEGVALEMAASWRGYLWAGIHIGDRQARFWGVPRSSKEKYRSKVIDFICHRIRITAFGYSKVELDKALKKINKFDPDYLYGYTSIIEEMANHLKSSSTKTNPSLKSIITTSEVLSEPTRHNIEEAFGKKVYDEYGCGEIGTIAHECEYGKLHLNMENSIVEIVDESGIPVPDGEAGEIVVTDLTNYSMPLIRYRIKDYGTISPDTCQCGRGLKVLENIYGRQYDSLINSEGRKFHGEFFLYIAEDAKKLGFQIFGIQFIQETERRITVNIAPNNPNTDLQSFIAKRINDDFDRSFFISFNWTDQIKREPSGKLRVVKYEAGSE